MQSYIDYRGGLSMEVTTKKVLSAKEMKTFAQGSFNS